MESKERIMEEFRRKGFRATPQRIAIAQIVLSSKDHPTAEQIYQAVKKKYPTLSPATVYQTLHLLTEIGLLQELGSVIGSPDTILILHLISTLSVGTVERSKTTKQKVSKNFGIK